MRGQEKINQGELKALLNREFRRQKKPPQKGRPVKKMKY